MLMHLNYVKFWMSSAFATSQRLGVQLDGIERRCFEFVFQIILSFLTVSWCLDITNHELWIMTSFLESWWLRFCLDIAWNAMRNTEFMFHSYSWQCHDSGNAIVSYLASLLFLLTCHFMMGYHSVEIFFFLYRLNIHFPNFKHVYIFFIVNGFDLTIIIEKQNAWKSIKLIRGKFSLKQTHLKYVFYHQDKHEKECLN